MKHGCWVLNLLQDSQFDPTFQQSFSVMHLPGCSFTLMSDSGWW
jgi:hypothetical protein